MALSQNGHGYVERKMAEHSLSPNEYGYIESKRLWIYIYIYINALRLMPPTLFLPGRQRGFRERSQARFLGSRREAPGRQVGYGEREQGEEGWPRVVRAIV